MAPRRDRSDELVSNNSVPHSIPNSWSLFTGCGIVLACGYEVESSVDTGTARRPGMEVNDRSPPLGSFHSLDASPM